MESAENRCEEKEMDPPAGWEDFMEEFGSLYKEGNAPVLIATAHSNDKNDPIMKYLNASIGGETKGWEDLKEEFGVSRFTQRHEVFN